MSARTAWLTRVGLVLTAFILVQSVFMASWAYTEWRQQFGAHFIGYSGLDEVEFYNLVADHTEVPIPLTITRGEGPDQRIVSFSLPEESTVYLSASADAAPAVFVQPLILKREDNRRFLLPLIRSSDSGRYIWNSIILGRFSPGQHTLALTQDQSSALPLPDTLQLSASRPSYNSYFSVFIDHSPVVRLKSLDNVLDDIPLVGYSQIYRRSDDYMVTSQLIFSSENGGTKPVRLMSSYQRTLDIEWVMKQIFQLDHGELTASHWLFQKKNHGEAEFSGKELFDSQPVLAIVTANNNFGDGMFHFGGWNLPLPSLGDSGAVIYYAPKPIFLPPGEWSQHIIDRIPELQQWSAFELAMEQCVDLSSQADPMVQQFARNLEWVRQHLTVSFPDRGCQSHKLQVT